MQSYLLALRNAPPGTLRVRFERVNIDVPLIAGNYDASGVNGEGLSAQIMRLTPNALTIVETLEWATNLSQAGFLQGLPAGNAEDFKVDFVRQMTNSVVNYGTLRLLTYGSHPAAVVVKGMVNTTNEGEILALRLRGINVPGPEALDIGSSVLKMRFNFVITEITDMKFSRQILEGKF